MKKIVCREREKCEASLKILIIAKEGNRKMLKSVCRVKQDKKGEIC